MSDSETDTPDFEAALAELEGLVEQMEAGAMTLDDSLKAFERGIKLTRICQTALNEAELKIKVLMQDGSSESLDADLDETPPDA